VKAKTVYLPLVFLFCANGHLFSERIAITGGTMIDVSNFGNSSRDVLNALIIIEDSKIEYAGKMRPYKQSEVDRIVDASGKHIVPGLVDGFTALDNQSFADSYLYMGVTSIIGVYGGRRAHALFEQAAPGPTIIKWRSLGDTEDKRPNVDSYLAEIERMAGSGVRVVLLMYELRPYELIACVTKAHSLGMGAMGELGYTSYVAAVDAGIDVLIHSSRYTMEVAPPAMKKAVAADPFGSPARDYVKWLVDLDAKGSMFKDYADYLGSKRVGLMPTLILDAIDLPETDNPWNYPIARISRPSDIHFPVDILSGKHAFDPASKEFRIRRARKIVELEKVYCLNGAKYLAGSGCDVYGTLPGISLHQELFWLTQIGLTPRQPLAASTWNYCPLLGLKEIGEIRAGKKGDVLVLEKNPVKDVKNLQTIYMVIYDGKVISRDELLKSNYGGIKEDR